MPAPFHFTESFWKLEVPQHDDKLAIGRGHAAIKNERERRSDLERISMLDWLLEKRQTTGAIGRFWGPVLVSAINEESGSHGGDPRIPCIFGWFSRRPEFVRNGRADVPLGEL